VSSVRAPVPYFITPAVALSSKAKHVMAAFAGRTRPVSGLQRSHGSVGVGPYY
jgi:hypothetical protein